MKVLQMQINKRRFLLVAAVLLIFILIFLNKGVSVTATQRVTAYFEQDTASLYHIRLKHIRVHVLRGSVSVDSVQIQPRSAVMPDSVAGLYSGVVGRIALHNFGYLKFLFQRKLAVHEVRLEQSRLVYTPNPSYVKPPKKRRKAAGNPVFNPQLKEISIDRIALINGHYVALAKGEPGDTAWSIQKLNLNVEGVYTDSSTLAHDPPFRYENVILSGEGLQSSHPANYVLRARHVGYDALLQQLTCSGFSVTPKWTRNQYRYKTPYENDWLNVDVDMIQLKGLDLHELMSEKHVYLEAVEVTEPQVSIYRDKRMNDAPYKHKPLPASMVRNIPVPVHIPVVHITGGKLTYEEQQGNANPPGMVYFNLHQVQVKNVCNITSELHEEPVMEARVEADLMGVGALRVQFNFQLNRAEDAFTMEGNLGKMPAAAFNPMAENMLNVRIVNGVIRNAEFSMKGTDTRAQGVMQLEYSNLHVRVLANVDSNKGLATFVAEKLLKDENLPTDAKYRVGEISYERDQNKGFPNFLWKSVFTGLKPILVPVTANK